MDVIQVSDDEIKKVRKHFKIKIDDIRRQIESLKEWLKEQPHLPQIDDDNLLERCLLRNKFRLEQTKQKLDGYCTLRRVHLNIYDEFQSVIPSKEPTTTLALPKLTPNLERVIIWKLKDSIPDGYNLQQTIRFNLLLFEILIRNDYACGDRFIADFTGHTVASMTRNNPILITRFLSLYQGAYSGRFICCDFINTPPFINLLLTVLKKLLPMKFYQRIRVHKDLKSLHRTIPKECLPMDYGGDLGTIVDLIEKWDKVFEHNRKIFEGNLRFLSNENLRRNPTINNQTTNDMFGVEGTFKQLNID